MQNKQNLILTINKQDLPTTLPDGLVIGAVLTRENPCDAVILHSKYKDKSLKTLPEGCLIGKQTNFTKGLSTN